MTNCKRCKGTGRINARISLAHIPDVNNCNFKEDCPDCKGSGKINDSS